MVRWLLVGSLIGGVLAGCAAAHSLTPDTGPSDAGLDAARRDASLPDAATRLDAAPIRDAALVLDAAVLADATIVPDASVPDAGDDAGCSSLGCDATVPRPIGPLSTAAVTSRRPTLRWILATGTEGAHVDLCADRACSVVLETIEASGTSAAPAADLPTGVVFWRLRSIAGGTAGATTSPTWQFIVGARTASIDTSWGTTLDVNGDGHGDLVVGAYTANRAYLYLGSAAGIASSPTATLRESAADNFGSCVASAGDVNGDGYADVIVAGDGGGGGAWVYLGGATGLTTSAATRLADPVGALDGFGGAASSAGDVNGDGYADVLIGAHETDHYTGAAYLFLGGPEGLAALPATTLGGIDGPGAGFGTSVASAGDVNGDGYGDVLIGASGVAHNVGRAYLHLGSATGLGASAATTFIGPDGVDGRFAAALAGADDLNGDGYADLVVGTYRLNGFTPRAYVYLGGPGPISSAPSVTLVGPSGSSFFGSAVASAGDVNGDGYADLAVGDYYGAVTAGRAFVYAGSASGIPAAPTTTLMAPDRGHFGYSIVGMGDVHGDGYADLAVGAPLASSFHGAVYAFPGGASGLSLTPSVALDAIAPTGSEFGGSIARAQLPFRLPDEETEATSRCAS